MVPLIWNAQDKLIYTDRKDISNCLGMGEEVMSKEWGVTANGCEIALWSYENVLK